MIDFSELLNPSTKITFEKVKEVREITPKRICFNTSHSHSLRPVSFNGNSVKWALFIPFDNTIKKIFEIETGLKIYKTKKGTFWCPIEMDSDYEKAKKFKKKYNKIVFLRDNLDSSIALSEHMLSATDRTEIGELEYKAKYKNCKDSLKTLTGKIKDFIESTHLYKDTNLICSVPPSINGNMNTPKRIAKQISDLSNLTDISNEIRWKQHKLKSLKEINLDEKWQYLEEINMTINADIKGKNIILIDDLYQSGTTLQFVAMKLKKKGCKKVFGISIVKSRKDTDNN